MDEKFTNWLGKFKKSGVISPVQLGISSEELMGILGEPDLVSRTIKKDPHAKVLKYGELEFHFGAGYGDELWMIFSDDESGRVKVCIGGF